MTLRAQGLLCLGLLGVLMGMLRQQPTLVFLSLSIVLWIFVEGVRFQWHLRRQWKGLRFQRSIQGRFDATGSLWSSRLLRVDLIIECSQGLASITKIRDIVPEILAVETDDTASDPSNETTSRMDRWKSYFVKRWKEWFGWEPELPPNELRVKAGAQHAVLSYPVRVRSAGQAYFPGVRLTFEDGFGFFRAHRFRKCEQRRRLLPHYYDAGEVGPHVKRINSLPQHGIHRLQRAGMGSELLELREYVVGDPPKSIAWKVSARRDKLMTRQYESEVPVRVHLFLDGSIPTRLGGYGLRLIDQLNFVAASVAKAAVAVGDPVSGVLVDELGSKSLPWYNGDRGFHQLLKELADFATTPPPLTQVVTPAMMQAAFQVCGERYPDLMEKAYRELPWSIRRSTHKRLLLTTMLAEIFELSAYEQTHCMLQESHLAYYVQELLCKAGLPWMDPVVPLTGELAVNAPKRMHRIGEAIAKATYHAHDNEIFVVLADLIDTSTHIHHLLRYVKLALAKHHRVAFVCPTSIFARPKETQVIPRSTSLQDLLVASEQSRLRDLTKQLQRELTRLGVSVAFAGEESAIQMILSEMQLARSGRHRSAHGAGR